MGFKKGKPRTGGRKRGTPNKVPNSVKQSAIDVFVGLGSVDAMIAWARRNKTDFYTKIWAKMIPRELDVKASVSIRPFAELSDDDLHTEIARLQSEVGGGTPGATAPGGPGVPG